MRRITSTAGSWQGLDFTPVLFAIAFVSLAIMIAQFSHAWPDASRGLLISERMCRIYLYYHSPTSGSDPIGIF
jgi:hypothetical protein